MSNIKQIQVVECDDWAGLYIDGRLAREDHDVRDEWLYDLLVLGFSGEVLWGQVRGEGYLYDLGRLPARIEEIPAEAWDSQLRPWADKGEARRRLGLL